MNTALVHHWLLRMRGGEKVLAAIARLWPEADIFTLFYDPAGVSEELRRRNVRASILDRLPGARRIHPALLPLYPLGCRSLDLAGYDLVISSDAALVKGVRVDPGAVHVCYCHSPPRYLWGMEELYLARAGPLARLAARLFFPRLRRWDRAAAGRVTQFVANSENVRRRIRECYGRESEVIHPPVEPFEVPPDVRPGGHYLFLGQLVAYKRADLAVEACARLGRRLVVIGDGPELPRLRRLAGPGIEFLGWQPDQAVRRQLAACRALVFPGEEDFGLVPLEAQMAGRPVVALGRGGALETVVDGVTGLFFADPTAESLAEALQRFERAEAGFSPEAARGNALRFRPEVFAEAFLRLVGAAVERGRQVSARRAAVAAVTTGGHAPETCPNPLMGRTEAFRWLRGSFEISLEPAPSGGDAVLRLDLESVLPIGEQSLSVAGAAGAFGRGLWLCSGRRVYPLSLPRDCGRVLRFRLSRTVPDSLKPGDGRELGVKLHGIALAGPEAAWLAPHPQVLVVEPTSRCNYACLMCCHAVGGPDRPGDFPEEWTERLRPLAADALTARMQGVGEPLLAPAFPRLVALVPPGRPAVMFSTNLSVLTGDQEDLLFRGSVREVSVSLDAATPETYRLIRGREIGPVLRNVERLIARRRRSGREFPRVTLSMTLMCMNIREAPAFVSLAHDLGADGVTFRHLADDPQHGWTVERDGFRFIYDQQHLKHAPAESDELLGAALARAGELGIQVEDTPNRATFFGAAPATGADAPAKAARGVELRDCPLPWQELHFRTDGAASFCCWQTPPGLPRLGEVAHVDEIWNSPAAQRFRAELAAGRLPPACRGAACRYARSAGADRA